MKNIIYIAPFPMATTMKFAVAIAGLDNIRLFNKSVKKLVELEEIK